MKGNALVGAHPLLGLDLYSLRSQGWTPFQAIEFCAAEGVEVIQFSMPAFLGGTEAGHLANVRHAATARRLLIEVGMGSICESAFSFKADGGGAASQLRHMLQVAQALGSPIVRCFLGSAEDRPGPGGGRLSPRSGVPLVEHVRSTVAACRAVADEARRMGIMIAIENHIGDLHSSELRELIDEAGADVVGALLDTGNAVYALEPPGMALEALGSRVIATHVRDSFVWDVEEGLAVQWCPLGQGNVGLEHFADQLAEIAPRSAYTLEIINPDRPHVLPWRRPDFQSAYQSVPPQGLTALRAAARGAPPMAERPKDERPAAVVELDDVRSSLRHAREQLNLGRQRSPAAQPIAAVPS